MLQPFQQAFQRTHGAAHAPKVDTHNAQHEQQVKAHHPARNGIAQVGSVNVGRGHREFDKLPLGIPIYIGEYTGRFLLPFGGQVHFAVGIADVGCPCGIVGRHFALEKLVVAAGPCRGQRLAAQRAEDDVFGVVFERIVHFVRHFVHEGEIEQGRPKGENRSRQKRQAQGGNMKQTHIPWNERMENQGGDGKGKLWEREVRACRGACRSVLRTMTLCPSSNLRQCHAGCHRSASVSLYPNP